MLAKSIYLKFLYLSGRTKIPVSVELGRSLGGDSFLPGMGRSLLADLVDNSSDR